MSLTSEQLEELGAALRGTFLSVDEALTNLGIVMEDDDYDEMEIIDALADDEETITCDSCAKWVFIESMEQNAMGDLICVDCAMEAMEDEDEDE